MRETEDIQNQESAEERTEPEEQEQQVLFPEQEEKTVPQFKKRKRPFSWFKGLLILGLLATVYLVGHFTRPEQLDRTLEQVRSLTQEVFEIAEPLKVKVTEKVTEIIDTKLPGKEKPAPSAAVSADGEEKPERKIKYWQAPMDPSYISDKPGKSPMGMDLVPVYEDEAGPGEGIRINPTVEQNIGVKTEKIKKRTLTREIRTVGRLTYDERKVTHIHTKYEGWIEKLYVDFTGQEVKKDQILVEIYSPQLVSTQEELLLALKYSESLKKSPFPEISRGAESLLESTRRRLQLFDVAEHQIEELIREKKITKTMHIHSPARGFVTKKNALQGMFVKPGMSLYTIADLSNIWVLADIYEYELPWVQEGQEAEMNLAYFPGRKFKGKVTYIDPFLEPKTRTVKVRMEFKNPRWELKPEMYANVTLKSEIVRQAVAVPEEAVIHSGERDVVIVRTPSGGFDSRDVTLGPEADGYYQVLKGLEENEQVVVSSTFLIDSESQLKAALKNLESTSPPKPSKEDRPSSRSSRARGLPKKPSGGQEPEGTPRKPPGIVKLKPEN